MVTVVLQNQKHSFNIFLIIKYVVTGISTIRLLLCHSLVRSVILFSKFETQNKK